MSNSECGTAVITGASSGIGALYADRLARRGHDLMLIARTEEKLASVAESLRRSTATRVATVVADLSKQADVRRVEKVLSADSSLRMLVNNAGVGAVDPLIESDVEQMERMIQLNITALTRLTYAVAPGFAARGRGAIINIASAVAIGP